MDIYEKDGPDGGSRAVALGERLPEELYRAGTEHFKLREYALARACFERYLEARPDAAPVWHLLARVYLHQNEELEKAEECLKKALELDHASRTRYIETLGVVYMHRGLYARAGEVLAYALTEDPRDDPRHTASLEYYLGLARKKDKAVEKPGREDAGAPSFLTTDIGRWREHRRQGLFLLPSLVVHLAVILVVGYLSTHDLPFREKFEEDFTYVEVEQEEAVPEKDAGVEPGGEGEGAAPITRMKPVKTGDVLKESRPLQGQVRMPQVPEAGQRDALGRKASAGVEAPSADHALVAKALPVEKGLDIRARPHAVGGGDVDLVRRNMSDVSGARGETVKSDAAVGGLTERAESVIPANSDGVYLGAPKQAKGLKWDKVRPSELKPETRPEPERAPPKAVDEKRVALGRPAAPTKDVFRDETKDFTARPLSIREAGQSRQAENRLMARAEPSRVLDRGEAAKVPLDSMPGRAIPGGAEKGVTGGKSRGMLGETETSPDRPLPAHSGTERGIDLPEVAANRRLKADDSMPVKRTLDLPASGAPQGSGKGSAPERGGPARLDRKEGNAALTAPSVGTAPASPGGYRVAGEGKEVNRSISAPDEQKSPESGGLLDRATRRVTGILGLDGRDMKAPAQEAHPRKSADLAGIGSGGGGAKGKASTAPGPAKGLERVKVGSGEKSQSGVPGAARADSVPEPGSGMRAAVPGEKKMAEGALGAPGGRGAGRYASTGRDEARPLSSEKQSGPGKGRAMGKGALGPTVTITSPTAGGTKQLTQVVRGTVSDTGTRKAVLMVNNDSRVISVERGSFESVVSLRKGRNIITVMAFDMDGNSGKAVLALDYSVPTAGPSINITSPRDGQVFDVSERSTTRVRGNIGDPGIKKARLIFNDRPMDIAVNRGYFDQEVALVREHNTILVEAVSRDGEVSRSREITVSTVNVKPKDIMIILTWDKPRADMDLHVYSPNGGHTYYKSQSIYQSNEAIAGGQLEQDAKGNFGPEVYTEERAGKGVYAIKSNYYYSGGDGDCSVTATVVLYGDNPSRRIVRVFGPHLQVDTKTGEDNWEIAKFKMPEGIFLEE